MNATKFYYKRVPKDIKSIFKLTGRKQTINVMAKIGKTTKRQTFICTVHEIRQRKLKTDQPEPHLKPGLISVALLGSTYPSSHGTCQLLKFWSFSANNR